MIFSRGRGSVVLLRAAGPGLVVCVPRVRARCMCALRPGLMPRSAASRALGGPLVVCAASRPLGSSSRRPVRPCRPRARLAVWGSLPPGPAKPVGSVDVLSGRSACELVAGVVHPICRHCTRSDRVQCHLTGVMPLNGWSLDLSRSWPDHVWGIVVVPQQCCMQFPC